MRVFTDNLKKRGRGDAGASDYWSASNEIAALGDKKLQSPKIEHNEPRPTFPKLSMTMAAFAWMRQ